MFDIGFSELLLVTLVALLVLGPERLPGAARTAGLWIGRLRQSFSAIKSEVEREIGADEIRRQLHNEQILAMERQQQAAQPAPAQPGDATSPEPSAQAPLPSAAPLSSPQGPAATETPSPAVLPDGVPAQPRSESARPT